MSSESPPEGPEHRTETLSPVSPKPLHYPSPSNIPILENQMDPAFGESSNEPAVVGFQLQAQGDTTSSDQYAVKQPVDISPSSNEQAITSANSRLQSDGSPTLSTRAVDAQLTSSRSPATNSPHPLQTPIIGAPHEQRMLQSGESDGMHSTPMTENEKSRFSPSDPKHSMQPPLDHVLPKGGVSGTTDGGGSVVDFQALLDTLSTSTSSVPATESAKMQMSGALQYPSVDSASHEVTASAARSSKSPLSLNVGVANLPPRPPIQDNNAALSPLGVTSLQPSHQSVLHFQGTSSNAATVQQADTASPVFPNVGAPGTSLAANGLPPPPLATFQQQQQQQYQIPGPMTNSINAEIQTQQALEPLLQRESEDGTRKEDEDIPWGPDTQKLYDDFLQDERRYVTEGQWDRFPIGSRLFIGNLPTEKVTKRDLFHVFHRHGKLAQVSIKQAYGFIQYLDAAACLAALQKEQGVAIRGRKIHLEISKPQRNHKAQKQNEQNRNKRSRSPDYGNKSGERYRGGGNNRQRDSRDHWRPGRSPSPRSRARNEYRSRDRDERYDGRRKSRSRSPYGQRRKSLSPFRGFEDDCPLPRRHSRDVPDVQIIAKDAPERQFISYVEKTFQGRGLRAEVLILSPRLSEQSVMRRQILEGVHAVLKLDRTVQMTHKFNMDIFDRSSGTGNVRFENYTQLDLNTCIMIVQRAKDSARANNVAYGGVSQYGMNPYGLPMSAGPQQQNQFPPPPPPPPLPSSGQQAVQFPHPPPSQPGHAYPQLDTTSLQQLLSRVGQTQPPQPYYANSPSNHQSPQLPPTADLSRLLANANQSLQKTDLSAGAPAVAQSYSDLASNPAFAQIFRNAQTASSQSIPQQQQQQSPPQQRPEMQNIMAQLARYGK